MAMVHALGMQMFFLIGWWYREDAIRWMQANYPAAAKSWDRAEDSFRHASYAAVVVEPGMIVCAPPSLSPFRVRVSSVCL
jgi:hypothetical protein